MIVPTTIFLVPFNIAIRRSVPHVFNIFFNLMQARALFCQQSLTVFDPLLSNIMVPLVLFVVYR